MRIVIQRRTETGRAYNAGRIANQKGKLENACPFDGLDPQSAELRDHWLEGWMDFQNNERASWEEEMYVRC